MQSAKQGKLISEEELSQAKETCNTLRKTFSQTSLADLREDFSFGRDNGHPVSRTFDYIDQYIAQFLKRPHQEISMTLVEQYITCKKQLESFLIAGNPIITLSYNQNTDSDIVTLVDGISPEDHLPFTLLGSAELPYDTMRNVAPPF